MKRYSYKTVSVSRYPVCTVTTITIPLPVWFRFKWINRAKSRSWKAFDELRELERLLDGAQ